MLTSNESYANLSEFRSATPKILSGALLQDVRRMQESILDYGLKTPLVISPNHSQLIVIDGRKRLLALRRLEFKSKLPPELRCNIPYLEIQTSREEAEERVQSSPVKIYRDIKNLQINGRTLSEISNILALPKDKIRRFLKLDRLSNRLLKEFLNHSLSLDQAFAFSTLPHPQAQDDLYARLGKVATGDDILEAIEHGQTVLALTHDNVIILPMRRPGRLRPKFVV